MRAWREVWDRSFPDWQLREDWALDKVEKSFAASYAEWAKDEFEKAKKYKWEDWHSAAMADLAITTDKRDPRDYRLHIIDDADTVMSMAKLPAGMGILKVCRETVTFEGVDTDGLPRFSDSLRRDVSRERVERRMKGKPVYWNWPFFLRYLGRKIVVAPATHAGAIFWDMAQHGHTHAFIKLTEGKGTWTVNLSGIDSIEAGQKRLQATVSNSKDNYDLIIQEHVPFTHEHRFYVVDGRLFASACSDRNFCTLDASGRRLDDRVAVLNRPSIDNGYYDRGITSHVRDRQMSAKFAKKARQIAAELKQHGILDYSLDMGMTERGPICIEVNTLHRAGPYNLRRDLYMEAYSRKIATLAGRIHAELREKIRQMGVGKRLTNWAYDVLERNKSRLPDIANTQYDLLSDCSSSSDQVPIAVFDTLAQSILITALLEQPIPAYSELEDAA
jgi:hypothetical protein